MSRYVGMSFGRGLDEFVHDTYTAALFTFH
jgi:hypothetical protein